MRQVILGIESSCDDTAAAVLIDGELKASVVSSQEIHALYGGVVPELASRDHQRLIVPVVETALEQSNVKTHDLSAVGVAYGPGLAGSLLVGLSFAKALALSRDIPLLGVNHLDGHIYSVYVDGPGPSRPFLCLIVSGGHTQLVLVEERFQHTLLARTRDDAAGEAFDKVAKLLGLGFPGGPAIDRLAAEGDPHFHTFPRSRPDSESYSFSGIKTSVLYYLNGFSEGERTRLLRDHLADICASFQSAVVDVLVESIDDALTATGIREVAVVGGVSANRELGRRVRDLCDRRGARCYIPRPGLCTDNAAMIAKAAQFKLASGHSSPLDLTAVPNLDFGD
jgi:N6-L-threonylcarbamoyladenine synthase